MHHACDSPVLSYLSSRLGHALMPSMATAMLQRSGAQQSVSQLGLAALHGRLQSVQELVVDLPNGANTRVQSLPRHSSLLSLAALGSQYEVCSWLLQAGADADSVNEALSAACVTGVSAVSCR